MTTKIGAEVSSTLNSKDIAKYIISLQLTPAEENTNACV